MFGPSYSNKSFLLTINILKELDERMPEDFEIYPPNGIPKNNEWQRTGLVDYLFNSDKKKKAQQRSVFNLGVMTGLADHYYDGKPSEFDKFLLKAVMSAVDFPKVVMSAKTYAKRYPKEFSVGVQWSTSFRERYVASTNPAKHV